MPKTKLAMVPMSALAAAVIALGGCGGGDGSDSAVVEMTDALTFAPPRISVAAGETITWRNTGEVPHDVVARGIRSPLVRGGEEWSTEAPDAAGELAYVCSLHPGMRGTVVVE